ncbi:MAG: DUF3990 domain-containing protein [Clostridiales Family XIII bacterium]|jgi:hypothetical protein|nr:DUF3990 domain-containing protein [Clostridiales Family XIII bacterium]
MILYHGSYAAIEKPALSFARLRTDFGKGFYLTPLKEQAASWSRRYVKERGAAVVSAYEFMSKVADKLPSDVKILEFDTHNLEWLDFITACRMGKPVDAEWDLVIGGVANDKVINTLELYFEGIIDADGAIERLRYHKPNHQYCFKRQKLIDESLRFIGSEAME